MPTRRAGEMMGGGYKLRHLGMIATSGSWRRWWLPLMWKAWDRAGLTNWNKSEKNK